MHIQYEAKDTRDFDSLEAGDVFKRHGRIFIKTDKVGCFNAVSLEDGRHTSFREDAKVYLVDYEFIVKGVCDHDA